MKKPCPSCGTGIVVVALSPRPPHMAPCGRPCASGSDVRIHDALSGVAHHRTQCECLKDGRGYSPPGADGTTTRSGGR